MWDLRVQGLSVITLHTTAGSAWHAQASPAAAPCETQHATLFRGRRAAVTLPWLNSRCISSGRCRAKWSSQLRTLEPWQVQTCMGQFGAWLPCDDDFRRRCRSRRRRMQHHRVRPVWKMLAVGLCNSKQTTPKSPTAMQPCWWLRQHVQYTGGWSYLSVQLLGVQLVIRQDRHCSADRAWPAQGIAYQSAMQ
jgi:hypothetical protein